MLIPAGASFGHSRASAALYEPLRSEPTIVIRFTFSAMSFLNRLNYRLRTIGSAASASDAHARKACRNARRSAHVLREFGDACGKSRGDVEARQAPCYAKATSWRACR